MNYYVTLEPDGNQQPSQPPQQNNSVQVDREMFVAQVEARTRSINAQARIQETLILLNGMAEIRFALNIPSVAENDTGQSERAPLKPMFEPEQVAQLQHGYIRMMEKYFKFTDHVMRNDYKITMKSDEPKLPE